MSKLQLSLLILSIAASMYSCGGNRTSFAVADGEAVVIPFETAIKNQRKVLMSEWVEKVEYIPLQTDTNCLIGNLWDNNVIRSQKFFFLACGKSLLQYTRDGKFVRTIGSVGQGPGEYGWITDIDVNDSSHQLFVSTTDEKINVYDTETGKFFRAIPFSGYEDFQFRMLNDTTPVRFLYNSIGTEGHLAIISDLHGDTLCAYPRYHLFTVKEGMAFIVSSKSDRFVYRSGGDICCRENYNDTIYTITRQALTPRYIIDLGKYHLPLEYRYELLGDDNKFNRMAVSYFAVRPIETARYLFLPYEPWGEDKDKESLAIYDKKSGECYAVEGGALSNDMDHLFDFQPTVALDDYTLMKVYSASKIFELAEKNPAILKNESLQYLQEDDNPVLMVVTLKK